MQIIFILPTDRPYFFADLPVYQKNNLVSPHWFRDMLNFDFFRKGFGSSFSSAFMYDFSRKMFLMPYSIKLTKFLCLIALLTDQISLSDCIINWPNFFDCIYLLRYWAICLCNCLFPRFWRHKFWNQHLSEAAYILINYILLINEKYKYINDVFYILKR